MNLVVTKQIDKQKVKCQFCDKEIASFIDDKMIPSAEECYIAGNVPIPNFGWFCSQDCAIKYEQEFDIKFKQDSEGKIDYYTDTTDFSQ